MKSINILLLIFITSIVFAQSNNEMSLFSFQTEKGVKISLSIDTTCNVLYFRNSENGTNKIVVKDNLNDSISIFKYSYYLRGGESENAALDLNYILFSNEEFNFEIYQEYSAEGNSNHVGFKSININTGVENDLQGIYN